MTCVALLYFGKYCWIHIVDAGAPTLINMLISKNANISSVIDAATSGSVVADLAVLTDQVAEDVGIPMSSAKEATSGLQLIQNQ